MEIGDLVVLNSESPSMTITEINYIDEIKFITCMWTDEDCRLEKITVDSRCVRVVR